MGSYLIWHYRDGLKLALADATNGVVAVLNYFSVLHLAQTLFSPWRRVVDAYGPGFMLSKFFWTLAGNIISRVIGAIIRLFVIFSGLAAGVIAMLFGLVRFLSWVFAPLMIPAFFFLGLILIFF